MPLNNTKKNGDTQVLTNVLTETKEDFDSCRDTVPELFTLYFDPVTRLWIDRFLSQN